MQFRAAQDRELSLAPANLVLSAEAIMEQSGAIRPGRLEVHPCTPQSARDGHSPSAPALVTFHKGTVRLHRCDVH
jgi:hypothetical protein